MNTPSTKSTDEKPLKKSTVTMKGDVKKLVKIGPANNVLDFFCLENYDLSGPFSPDDISYEMCTYNDEAMELETGIDLLRYKEYVKQADFGKEFKVTPPIAGVISVATCEHL